jgi:hypothetical protein
MQSISSALEAKRRFEERSPENTKSLLLARGVKDDLLVSALKEWKELAKAYGIEGEKLRPDDYIADLVETDWFGDRGLMIEARLTRCGVKELPRDMTILQLVLLLSSTQK